MIQEILNLAHADHYLPLMLAVILACILLGRNMMSGRIRPGSFWITILVCVLLVATDILEDYAQMDPARRTLRMFTTVAGYTLRPMAVLGFLLVIWPPEKKRWFLWIPAIVNFLLYASAWFTPLTFTFGEEYNFTRGPLGWFMLAPCLLYLILILIMVHIRFKDRRVSDTLVIYLCVLGCLGAMWIDIRMEEILLVSAILISCMTFYLFLRAQDSDHDPLTRLRNRMSFYEDCNKYKNTITAAAAIDMNGLKKVNDELGHDAGDRALRMIGRGLQDVADKKTIAYRVGGDEFIMLFFHHKEEEIRQLVQAFQNEMWRVGLNVAVGTAFRPGTEESLEELLRTSDRRMYEDKSAFYRLHDRRRGSRMAAPVQENGQSSLPDGME